jgi:hypothetical protein
MKMDMSREEIEDLEIIDMNIYYYEKGVMVRKTVQKMTVEDNDVLMNTLNRIVRSNVSVQGRFEKTLSIFKEYNLVDKSVTLADIMDVGLFGHGDQTFDNVTGKNFQAQLAPILVVGGGFGVGLGIDQRKFNGFTHFFALVGGLGAVLCFDPTEAILYILITYLLPLLVGYLAGYMGFIVFAVYPGLFYSNLVMLGFVPFTIWIQIPNPNP